MIINIKEENNEKDFNSISNIGYDINFENLNKMIRYKDKDYEILHNISGCCKQGELMCIMGNSGSGKTTLLNLLGGRQFNNTTAGDVYINNIKYVKPLRKRIAFVLQDDIFLRSPAITVYDQLLFSALGIYLFMNLFMNLFIYLFINLNKCL
jgi:ABC-type multidrug transport system ATPase subunit